MKASWCQERCWWKEASVVFICCEIRSICRRINQRTGRVWWCFVLCLFALAFCTLTCKRYVFAVQRDRFICSQDKAWNSGRAETRVCSWSSKKRTVCWTRIVSGNLNAEWKKRVKSEVSGNAVLRSTFYNCHQRNKYCLVLQSIQNFTEPPHWRRQVERLGFYFITCTPFQI